MIATLQLSGNPLDQLRTTALAYMVLSTRDISATATMRGRPLEEPPALVPRHRPSDELRQFLEDL
jgi:hypothetical protein